MVRGKVLPAQTPAPIVIDTSIHNRFDVEVVDAKTKKVKQRAQAFNVVCNGLWAALNKTFSVEYYTGWFNSIAFGTGSGTPAETDAVLFKQIDKMSGLHATWGCSYEENHVWVRKDISITELMHVGETITEFGIVDAAGILCTHAMLQDMNGNQISIEKTDTDIINIYATVFIHFPAEVVDGDNGVQVSLSHGGSGRSFLRLLMGWHESEYQTYKDLYRVLPSKGRNFTQGTSTNEKVNTILKVPASFDVENRKLTFSGRIAAVNNNIEGGLGWLMLQGSNNYMYTSYESAGLILKTVPPVFPGSNVVGEAIGTGDGETVDFATKFDFPENAKIYVDGVLQQNVTVDCVPLSHANMGKYFEAIVVHNGEPYVTVNKNSLELDTFTPNKDNIGEINKSDTIFYNPYYEYGIKSFAYEASSGVFISDDLETWITIKGSETGKSHVSGTYTVPEEYKHYRYFRIVDAYGNINYKNVMRNFVSESLTGKNIHFANPPAVGAVITADYDTKVVTKDANHVFDLNIVIQLNPYSEA